MVTNQNLFRALVANKNQAFEALTAADLAIIRAQRWGRIPVAWRCERAALASKYYRARARVWAAWGLGEEVRDRAEPDPEVANQRDGRRANPRQRRLGVAMSTTRAIDEPPQHRGIDSGEGGAVETKTAKPISEDPRYWIGSGRCDDDHVS